MELYDVTTKEQLGLYYNERGLYSPEDKIDYLIRAMKIRAIRYDGTATENERLEDLEETALFGYYRTI